MLSALRSPLSALRSPLSAVAISFGLLTGCASNPCCVAPKLVQPVSVCNDGLACGAGNYVGAGSAVGVPNKLRAVGYGAPGAYTQYTHGQQKLMAMRAAQVDAYRNLAEQVYGFRVWGSTAVSAFATQSDVIRSYVDAYIRGARVVNMTSIADGNFEATVELDLPVQFFDCLTHSSSCGVRQSALSCTTQGCTSPSATYISN